MAMGILLDHVRRKLRKKLPKRRENNGHKLKKQGNKSNGKRGEMGSGSNPTGQKQNEIGAAIREITTQNNFDMLSNPEEQVLPVLEEGEVQQSQDLIREENKDSAEQDLGTLAGGSSPIYAEMAKKKPMDNCGSSEEDSLERSSKKWRISHKKV